MEPKTCPYCEAKSAERVSLARETRKELHQEIELDVCSGCEGIWFDAGELKPFEKVIDTVLIPFSLKNRDTDQMLALDCPACANSPRMEKMTHPMQEDVIIDHCSGCGGIWLDSGELLKIQERSIGQTLISLFSELL